MKTRQLHDKVKEALHKKYELSFSFFTTKYINQFIYSVGTPMSIYFEFQKAFYDDIEYLRRMYRHKIPNGKLEIEDRIRLVSKYYQQNEIMSSDIPLMAIPKLKDIFMRRNKRIRKLIQQKDSSQTQHKTSSFANGSLSFSFDEDFLKQLNLHFDQLMDSDDECINQNNEYDSEVHDVYQDFQNDNIQVQENKVNLNSLQVQHLVCDFQDIDVENVINFYKDIKKSKNGSVIMSEILQEQHKLSKRNSIKTRKSDKNKDQIQRPKQQTKKGSSIEKSSVLSSYISIFGPRAKSKPNHPNKLITNRYTNHLLIDRCVEEYKQKFAHNVQNAEQQIQQKKDQLKENREKIRKKAQKLLQKIKKQSFSTEVRI